MVCSKWRRVAEDDTLCVAWKEAAEQYYLFQNGTFKKSNERQSWKSFFQMMIEYEEMMINSAFDEFQEEQEIFDEYSEGYVPYDDDQHYYDDDQYYYGDQPSEWGPASGGPEEGGPPVWQANGKEW